MTVGRKRLATAAAAVTVSEAKIDKQRTQMTTINAQLEEAVDTVEAAANIQATLRTDIVA